MTVVLDGMNRHVGAESDAQTDSTENSPAAGIRQLALLALAGELAGKEGSSKSLPAWSTHATKGHLSKPRYVTFVVKPGHTFDVERVRFVGLKQGRGKVMRRSRRPKPEGVRVVQEALEENQVQLRNTARALAEVLQHTAPGLEASPEVARSVQASENRWRIIADEYGLLDSRAVDELLGGSGTNRNRAHQLAKDGKIIGVKRGRGIVYPGFEFEHGEVRPVIAEVAAIGRRNKWSDAHLLLWLASPNGYLEGRVPARMLDQTDKVLEAARQDLAERW